VSVAGSTPPVARLVGLLEPRLGSVRELDEPRPLEQLVLLMLARGATLPKARRLLKTLQTDYVDWNDVRVTSVREIASKVSAATGAKGALEKAQGLLDLLSMVYHRFNRINLDFLQDGEGEEAAKKKTRLFAWLSERSHLWPAMLTLHGAKKPEVVVDGGLPRVLGRLGITEPKATPQAARQRLVEVVPEDLLITFQFVTYLLSEEFCHAKAPDCPECPAKPVCPSADALIKAGRDAEKKPAAKKAAAQGAKPRKRAGKPARK
jgi:endonuclease-3